MPSPLFPNFNRFTRQQLQAMEQWLASQSGSSGSAGGRGRGPRAGRPTSYGRGRGPGPEWLWKTLLSKLGPVGQVIQSLLRPQGRPLAPDVQRELQAAQQLLEEFGYFVGQPGQQPGQPGQPGQARRPMVERVNEEPPEPPARPGVPTTPRRSQRPEPEPQDQQAGQAGQAGPLVEGMIPVTSSNVHSIGYEWNAADPQRPGNLLVRFLGGTGKHRSGPGPLYRYFEVSRDVFTQFKIASSKGEFVWDELRVRGSVVGHQYNYELAGITGGYVPRQAGLKRGAKGEFYLQRTFQGRRSQLPERQVRGARGELTPDFRNKARRIDFRAGRR